MAADGLSIAKRALCFFFSQVCFVVDSKTKEKTKTKLILKNQNSRVRCTKTEERGKKTKIFNIIHIFETDDPKRRS